MSYELDVTEMNIGFFFSRNFNWAGKINIYDVLEFVTVLVWVVGCIEEARLKKTQFGQICGSLFE